MTDRDRISTRQLNRLRRRILRVYGTARREMQEQLTEFLAKYKALDERKRAQLDAGEITEEDYRIWLQNQVFQSDLMRAKLDGITQTCTTAQETAYKLARDEQYNIFSFGANWAFYELEQAAGVTFGLTLYNTEAVKLLLKENPKLVPNKRIKSESNRTYDARVFNRYVMQGIVQGKSVHDIAVQAVNGMADTEIHWAMNNAITALTSAQNARAILDALTAQRIEAKDAKIAEQSQQLFAAQLAASQAAQNETLKAYMSGQLAYYNPRPVPAFPVPAPYQYGNCGTGCGCNGCA